MQRLIAGLGAVACVLLAPIAARADDVRRLDMGVGAKTPALVTLGDIGGADTNLVRWYRGGGGGYRPYSYSSYSYGYQPYYSHYRPYSYYGYNRPYYSNSYYRPNYYNPYSSYGCYGSGYGAGGYGYGGYGYGDGYGYGQGYGGYGQGYGGYGQGYGGYGQGYGGYGQGYGGYGYGPGYGGYGYGQGYGYGGYGPGYGGYGYGNYGYGGTGYAGYGHGDWCGVSASGVPLSPPVSGNGTYPYDGGPQQVVPMPGPGMQPLSKPTPGQVPLEGRLVSRPAAKTGNTHFVAYGESPSNKIIVPTGSGFAPTRLVAVWDSPAQAPAPQQTQKHQYPAYGRPR